MYVPPFVLEALGWLSYQFVQLQPLIPTYTHLIVSAIFPIYAGAYSSLSRPSSAAKPEKKKRKDGRVIMIEEGEEEEEEEEEERQMEGLSPSDAIVFPILAGCTLAGLYFLIKWLQDPALLNKFLNWYFAFFSVFSVSRLVSDGLDVVHSLIFPRHYIDKDKLFMIEVPNRRAVTTHERQPEYRQSPLPGVLSKLPLSQSISDLLFWLRVLPKQKVTFKAFVRSVLSVKLRLGVHGLLGLIAGLASVLYYNFVGKPWFLTNIMGFGFAYGALQLMSPTTFWTGTLILSALFFYDIYFVFFTPMMVTVAKSLDVPIKLLFPRPAGPDADPGVQALSMLGLGDVVLPGMMIGLALRFDLFMFYLRKQTKFSPLPQANADSKLEKPGKTEEESKALTDQIIKAPYKPVSEGWGDRLWTSWIFGQKPTSFTPRGAFPKPYFHASIVGYVAGMLMTLGAMQVSDHPQPALLYLVPSVLCSLWGAAWVRGEIHEMWVFSEVRDEEEGDKEGQEGNGKTKKARGSAADEEDGSKNQKDKDKSKSKIKKGGRSSIFSYSRAEERSKRLEAAMNNNNSSKSDQEAEADDDDTDTDGSDNANEDDNDDGDDNDVNGQQGGDHNQNKDEGKDGKEASKGGEQQQERAGASSESKRPRIRSNQASKQSGGPILVSFSIRAPISPFLERSSSVSAPEKAESVSSHDRMAVAVRSDDDDDAAADDKDKDKEREHVNKRLRIS